MSPISRIVILFLPRREEEQKKNCSIEINSYSSLTWHRVTRSFIHWTLSSFFLHEEFSPPIQVNVAEIGIIIPDASDHPIILPFLVSLIVRSLSCRLHSEQQEQSSPSSHNVKHAPVLTCPCSDRLESLLRRLTFMFTLFLVIKVLIATVTYSSGKSWHEIRTLSLFLPTIRSLNPSTSWRY